MTEYSKVILALAWIILATLPIRLSGEENPIVITDIIQIQETCELDNGQITIIVEGNSPTLRYSIDGGLTYSSSNHFENLDSKDYLIVVTDGPLCTEVYTAQIADAGYPELTLTSECITGLNRSVITPQVIGGSKPYSFDWEGPNGTTFSTETIDEAAPGAYNVTITDNLGCTFSDNITVVKCCSLNLSCDLQDENFECIDAVPESDPQLISSSSSESTINAILKTLGIDVVTGACGPLRVQVQDYSATPTGCSDNTLRVTREYTISDAHTEVVCSRELSIANYIKAETLIEAQDMIISCDSDIETVYQAWLDNNGGMDYLACTAPIIISTIPASPVLDPTCGVDNLVTFVVEDGCGNRVESMASFMVVDDEAPTLDCPASLTINPVSSDLQEILDNWLASASGTDNCSANQVRHDFDLNSISTDCDDEPIIEVNFTIEDNCGSADNCTSTLTVKSPASPVLNCGEDLFIQCGEDIDGKVVAWMDDFSGYSAQGESMILDHNVDLEEISSLVCGEFSEVTFSLTDECGRDQACSAMVTIIDDIAPEITCPNDISIELDDHSRDEKIQAWLDLANATDCNSVTLSDDFDLDLNSIQCSELIPVTYIATDLCGLTNNCMCNLTLIKKANLDLSCPEGITLLCTDPELESLIEDHISQVTVTSDNDYESHNDFDPIDLESSCEDPITLEVNISALDYCNNEAECRTRIDILPDPKVYIPNVFSPDGDGIEDRFTAFTNSSVELITTMIIYNQWGSKVFEKTDFPPNEIFEGWDGTYRSKKEPTEVFTYYIVLMDTMGEEMEKVGTVQILRK